MFAKSCDNLVGVCPRRHQHPAVRPGAVDYHDRVLRTHPETLDLDNAAVRLTALLHAERLTQQFHEWRPALLAEPAVELFRTFAADQNATLPATGKNPDHAGFQVR
ncbi:hypothetical protein ASF09_03620 [Sphingomonas sp. Leaf242]|nr:hypothetical protein ASF09_03620 [Sphingomonas sp. Leaf242]